MAVAAETILNRSLGIQILPGAKRRQVQSLDA
jgi:hypothetical protein